MKAYWGSGGVAPRILNLGTRWRWVVSFTPRPLYTQGKSPWYLLDRRLGGPQSRSDDNNNNNNNKVSKCRRISFHWTQAYMGLISPVSCYLLIIFSRGQKTLFALPATRIRGGEQPSPLPPPPPNFRIPSCIQTLKWSADGYSVAG
jgi:hypothetical protein